MAIKSLVTYLKLNTKQRTLHKAGLVDENGNLTESGTDVLLNLVLEDYTDKMVALAKEYKKDEACKED
jgi:hypothetical protein